MKRFLLSFCALATVLGSVGFTAKADVGDNYYDRTEPRWHSHEEYREYRDYRECAPPPRVIYEERYYVPRAYYGRGECYVPACPPPVCAPRVVVRPHPGFRFYFGF